MNSIRVILDTNFLLIPGQFKVDIFRELKRIISTSHDVYIFKETIDELNKIAQGKKKDNVNAKIGLELIKQKNLKSLKNSSSVEGTYIDQIILENVQGTDIVCTQDKALKRFLKQKHIKIITLKSKQYLDFE